MDDLFDQIIIGTGPSAFACHKSLPTGSNCLILDSSCHPVTKNNYNDILLGSGNFKINQILRDSTENSKTDSGIINKAFSGLDYTIITDGIDRPLLKKSSNNFGGLSPYWGHQLIRYTQNDLDDIGIGLDYSELMPFYDELEKHIGLSKSGEGVNLAPFYDLKNVNYQRSCIPNSVASKLVDTKIKKLIDESLSFDTPLLALAQPQTFEDPSNENYNYYGINSDETFDCSKYFSQFLNSNLILQNRRVLKITVEDGFCKVMAVNDCGDFFEYKTRKVFLAAGCINSAEIIRKSLDLPEIRTHFFDHRTRLMPVFVRKAVTSVNKHINQLVGIRKIDGKIQNFMSLYSLSSMTNFDVSNLTGLPYPFSLLAVNILREHFHVLQIWENEFDSSQLILNNSGVTITDDHQKISLGNIFYINLLRHGIYPLPFASKYTLMGEGFHFVGTFSRNNINKKFQTDRLGQLVDLKNIHLIDGSVIPKLTVKNSSLLQMANAARITKEVYS